MLSRGSKGSLDKQYRTKVTSQSGKEGGLLGLCVRKDAKRSDTTLECERSNPIVCDKIGDNMIYNPLSRPGPNGESQTDGIETQTLGLEFESMDQSTFQDTTGVYSPLGLIHRIGTWLIPSSEVLGHLCRKAHLLVRPPDPPLSLLRTDPMNG